MKSSTHLNRTSQPSLQRSILLTGSFRPALKRLPHSKRLVIRGSSMRPQFKIAAEVLQSLWQAGKSGQSKRRSQAVLLGAKSSGKHYLSVKVSEVEWAGRVQLRGEDYAVPLLPTLTSSHLEAEYQQVLSLLSSLQASLEPLHLCRSLCSCESAMEGKLRLRLALVYPEVSLQFTQVERVEIWGGEGEGFEVGFAVQDKSGRISLLTRLQACETRKPFIGLWARGVPAGNQPTEYPFLHPLIWAAAVQFLQMDRKKIISGYEKPSFLFVYLAAFPSFYEVCISVPPRQDESKPSWQTAVISKTVSIDSCCLLTFFLDDLAEEESTSSSSAHSTPARHISKLPSLDSNCSFFESHRTSLDPEAKIRLLELQVQELQKELKRTQSLCSTPALSPKGKQRSEGGRWDSAAINRSGVLFKVDEFEEVSIDVTAALTPRKTAFPAAPGVAAARPIREKAKSVYFSCVSAEGEKGSSSEAKEVDLSCQIPLISYESDSSSDEDSFSMSLQRKYLI